MSDEGPDGKRNPVARAFTLIEHFLGSGEDELGVREIATALGWAPSTTHRIVRLLEAEGLLVSNSATDRYRLGLRLLAVALAVPPAFPVVEAALPIMRRLVGECDETVMLGIYNRASMELTFVTSVESSQPVRFVADQLGRPGPLHAGASGLGVFAFLPEDERRRYAERPGLEVFTPRTETDPERLEELVAEIREQGYVRSTKQRSPGAVGVAAPIMGPDGRPIGDLLITLPESRFEPESEPVLAEAVVRHAREISAAVYGRLPTA